jgi:outer membrane immunogenic protein
MLHYHRTTILTAVGLSLGLIAVASAADLGTQAPVYTKAPPPAPWTWTGFYIGGDIGGYGIGQSARTDAFPTPGFGAPAIVGGGLAGVGILPTSSDFDHAGVLGGFYGGFNWQVSNWVLGIEGDYSWLSRSGNSDTQPLFETFTTPAAVTGAMTLTESNRWLASVRGRVGWTFDTAAIFPGVAMVYGTGGAAFTHSDFSAFLTPGPPNGVGLGTPGGVTGPSSISFTEDKTGWVAGGGVEYMFLRNWLVRAEYLFYRFDGTSAIMPLALPPGSGACPGCGFHLNFSDLDVQTGRIGVSYKFWP